MTILPALEIPVKQELPTFVKCPFCDAETLGVFIVPLAGGRWYYCRECGFGGDSIELYHRVHNLPDIRDAIFEMLAKKLLPLTRDQVQLETANSYISAYITKRKGFEALFKQGQENLNDVGSQGLALLHEYHLWGGYRAGHWHKHISQFVGLVHPKEARAHGFSIPRTAAFRRLLVMPSYDIPGRICALTFFGFKGSFIREHVEFNDDDGLMMLDVLPLYNESVITMTDPIFALQLQRRQFNRTRNPLPILVHGAGTSRAWGAVRSRRVIFWDRNVDYWLYKQAMKHPQAHIAIRPKFADRAAYLDKNPLPVVLERFHKSAQSWGHAMRDLILDGEHWKVTDFVLNLDMTEQDKQRIKEVCTPAQKERVDRALGEVPLDRFVYAGGMRISESDDRWWIVDKDHRELGCSAIIRLDSAIHIPDVDQNYYEGVVVSKGKQIRFCEKMDVIEKKTAVWLRDLMMRNGLPPPTVQSKLKTQLIAIAKQFQEPRYVQRSGKVGWNAELQGFVFPNFTVRFGAIDESNRAMVYDTKVPGANLHAGSIADGDWDDVLEDRPESAAVWAGLACFMTNLVAPVISAAPSATGFIGGSGSVARIIGRHIVTEMDMVLLETKKPRLSLNEIMEHEQAHGYPLWLDITMAKRNIMTQLSASSGGNFMMDLLEGEATALAVGEQWVFVRAPMIANQSRKLPSLSGIVRYLAWLQNNSFTLQPADSLHMSFLQSLREWADADIGLVKQDVFRSAEQMLVTPYRSSMEQRLLHLVFWLQMNGNMKMLEQSFYAEFKAGIMAPCRHILVDPVAQKVYVSMQGLGNGIRSAKLPAPDLDAAIQEAMAAGAVVGFEMGTECFVVNYPYWAAELKKWMQLRP
jgi:hypothetical protein